MAAAVDATSFALVMRVYNTALLSLLVDEPKIGALRSREIHAMIEQLRSHMNSFESLVQKRIDDLNAHMRREKVVSDRRTAIKRETEAALAPPKVRLNGLIDAAKRLGAIVRHAELLSATPLTLCVEVRNGEVNCHMHQPGTVGAT